MPRFLSAFRSLLVVLAVVVVAACGSKEDDAATYAKSMSDRHDALAEALVLYGNMVGAFQKNPAVIDRDDYIAAEETMKDYMNRIGGLRELEKIPLPGNGEELKLVHDYFMISVSYLYESQAVLEETGYDPAAALTALGLWEEARKNFLTFAESLNQLEGKPPLGEAAAPPGDAALRAAPDDKTPGDAAPATP